SQSTPSRREDSGAALPARQATAHPWAWAAAGALAPVRATPRAPDARHRAHRTRDPRHTGCATLLTVVQSAFLWVVVGVCVVGVVGVIVAVLTSRRDWAQYGSDRLLLDSELPRAAAGDLQRDEEVRQMLEARNARRRRRGEP